MPDIIVAWGPISSDSAPPRSHETEKIWEMMAKMLITLPRISSRAAIWNATRMELAHHTMMKPNPAAMEADRAMEVENMKTTIAM